MLKLLQDVILGKENGISTIVVFERISLGMKRHVPNYSSLNNLNKLYIK